MDEGDFAARIEAARGDYAELGRIADELQSVGGSAASRLRLKAIVFRSNLKRNAITPPTLLEKLGIGAVDGRPLHRYGLNEDQFHALQKELMARRSIISHAPSREIAGQFVLWAAEWFRRFYNGAGQRWDALGTELGLSLEQSQWRRLADEGMTFWRIPPFKLNGIHHRLAAIARQGGFPVAALEGSGWASRFLEPLVATLAAMPACNVDEAVAQADRLIGAVPETWRSRELRVAASELAIEVVRLRRLAEADGVSAGALVSAWLDRHLPDWRDQLPLSIGSDAARTLIDGLLRVVPLRGGHDAIRCIRWLEIGAQGRREGVELLLSGMLRDATGKILTENLSDDWSRLRLYAAEQFAQHVAGELAVADPDDGGDWRARPSISRTRFDLAPEIAVTGELRGDGKRIGGAFRFPGGEAVTAEVRVYADEGQSGDPLTLRLLGTGSGGYRADQLFVDIPSSWIVRANGSEATCGLLHPGAEEGRSLWQVSGAALVTSPNGDAYLVRAGQVGTARDRLLIGGTTPSFAPGDANSIVVIGEPFLRIEEAGRERRCLDGELWWRPEGTAAWRPDPASAVPGPCEFAWRDRISGHIRDRRIAIVLPNVFAVETSRVGDWLEVKVSGWPYSASAAAASSRGAHCWRLPVKANTLSALRIAFATDDDRAFEILVPLHHQAWIENWDDGPLRRNARISLSSINRYVARAERCELMADLVDRNRREVSQSRAAWWVDGEMPLSAIRDDLAALLRPCGDIRYEVKLNFNDGNEDYWWVGEFEHELIEERGGFVASPAIAEDGVRIVRRPLHDPMHEQDCGPFSLTDSNLHRPLMLPRQQGTALVYLRSGDRVLSVPKPVESVLGAQAQTPLGRAMTIANWHERKAALAGLAAAACSEPNAKDARKLVQNLVDLVVSLDGLPPATFDALLLLCEQPGLAPLMLFQARREEIEPIMRLADGLPFAWWSIPRPHWEAAAKVRFDTLLAAIPDQVAAVGEDVVLRMREIEQIDPILAPLLGFRTNGPTLEQAVMAFFQRSHDRIETSSSNPFRPEREPLLPRWKIENDRYWRAFDAPVIAALAANGRLELAPPELTTLKDIARRHPRWFQEGFAAAMEEL